jgi:hypothetical protein
LDSNKERLTRHYQIHTKIPTDSLRFTRKSGPDCTQTQNLITVYTHQDLLPTVQSHIHESPAQNFVQYCSSLNIISCSMNICQFSVIFVQTNVFYREISQVLTYEKNPYQACKWTLCFSQMYLQHPQKRAFSNSILHHLRLHSRALNHAPSFGISK